jgi:hypothetical protein
MTKPNTKSSKERSVLAQIADIEHMSLAELRYRWREIFAIDPPGYSRVQLVRRLAYRVQELAYGGLSAATREKLAIMAESVDAGNGKGLKRRRRNDSILPGTRLIREWNGRRYEVVVGRDGFEFEGRPYRSLTAIAEAITQQHWNGPLFFGLRRQARKKDADDLAEPTRAVRFSRAVEAASPLGDEVANGEEPSSCRCPRSRLDSAERVLELTNPHCPCRGMLSAAASGSLHREILAAEAQHATRQTLANIVETRLEPIDCQVRDRS